MQVGDRFWAHATAVIDQPATIGDGTRIWHFCHVMAGARIGERCVLGQNVFVASRAVIGDGCKIQNHVSIYDDPRAFIERKHEYRTTVIGRGASIGANATVVCGHRIGVFAFIAAGAVVTKDVPAYGLVMGVPGRVVGWICRCGVRLPAGDLPACSACGQRYKEAKTADGSVTLVPEAAR